MRTMIVAFIILTILSFTGTNYIHKDPAVFFETESGEKVDFIFSELDEGITCKYNVEVEPSDDVGTDLHEEINYVTTWGEIANIVATPEQWTEVESFKFDRASGSGGNSYNKKDTRILSHAKLYRYTVVQDEINYDHIGCSFQMGNQIDQTGTEKVSESCYAFPIAGKYEIAKVSYDYTDNNGTNHSGDVELKDNQKQTTTLHCKNRTNIMGISINFEINESDYSWLQEYLDKNGYKSADISVDEKETNVRIQDTENGPKIAMDNPNIAEEINNEASEMHEASGEIHFAWEVKTGGNNIHLVLTPLGYPFSFEFKKTN
jgi:hypothetical protein